MLAALQGIYDYWQGLTVSETKTTRLASCNSLVEGCGERSWKDETLSFPSLKNILKTGTTGPKYVRVVGKSTITLQIW